MSRVKKTCKVLGCTSMTMSLGKRGKVRQYDKDGYLERKVVGDLPYYSAYCRKHQKAYNRLSTLTPVTAEP